MKNFQCPSCDSLQVNEIANVLVGPESFCTSLCHCVDCDFLYLANHEAWLESAYQESFYGDTGYMQRNLNTVNFMELFLLLLSRNLPENSPLKCCDFGTGLGIFPRMMRDRGFDYWGFDDYATMDLIKPFLADHSIDFDVVTAFEVVEHLPKLSFWLNTFKDSWPSAFIFSTELRANGEIPSLDWWYYAYSNGQHISFHSEKSLKVALKKELVPHKLVRAPGTNIYCLAINDKIENIFRRAAFLYRLLQKFKFYLNSLRKMLGFSRASLTWNDHIYAMKAKG